MSRREDTCPGRKCPFWKKYGEYCPHYVEGTWESKEGEKYTTKDCAPKRSMILQQQIYDQLIGVRRDYNQTRNASHQILQLAAHTVGGEIVIEGEVEEHKQIEDNKDNGKDTD